MLTFGVECNGNSMVEFEAKKLSREIRATETRTSLQTDSASRGAALAEIVVRKSWKFSRASVTRTSRVVGQTGNSSSKNLSEKPQSIEAKERVSVGTSDRGSPYFSEPSGTLSKQASTHRLAASFE